jgi:hypothetical protein
MSVFIGESLYHGRSALEHLVWGLVKVNHKKPGRHNSFPTWSERNGATFLESRTAPARGRGRPERSMGSPSKRVHSSRVCSHTTEAIRRCTCSMFSTEWHVMIGTMLSTLPMLPSGMTAAGSSPSFSPTVAIGSLTSATSRATVAFGRRRKARTVPRCSSYAQSEGERARRYPFAHSVRGARCFSAWRVQGDQHRPPPCDRAVCGVPLAASLPYGEP